MAKARARHILVDDEKVLQLESGIVPESELSSGSFMIERLYEKLDAAVAHQRKVYRFNKKKDFEGIVTIVADRHIPFRLLSQVMYTSGQAQFSKFKFMVVKGGKA